MLCLCCKGALTFDEARFVKERLTRGRAVQNPKDRDFKAVPATASIFQAIEEIAAHMQHRHLVILLMALESHGVELSS
jgi:hypothetical protein